MSADQRRRNGERGRRPIGYWLKHLDGLIEAAFERTLTLHERPSIQVPIADVPGADERVTDELMARGWVQLGRRQRAEADAGGDQGPCRVAGADQATRQRLVRGVTQEEYLATVDVLGPDGREPRTRRGSRGFGALEAVQPGPLQRSAILFHIQGTIAPRQRRPAATDE